MNVYELEHIEKFVHPVLDNGVSKVVQFSFPKGKVLEKHRTTSDILVFVLQGEIIFNAGQEARLTAGHLISLEKNIEHSIEALEDSLVVLVLTPSPSAHTILKPAAEVLAGDRHGEEAQAGAKAAVAPQLQSFVEEHAELLEVLKRAAGGYHEEAYATADRMIGEELDRHFRYEEEILFPLLGNYIGTEVGPIAVMLSEHRIIREYYATFHAKYQEAAGKADGQSDVFQAFTPLENMLRTHITKEDNVLFPMASRVMSEADKNEVARRVAEEKHE